MKEIIIFAISMISVFCINTQSYAGQWKLNNVNWQYTNEDGSLTKNQWKQISGQWYCFDNNGNMYANTFTPDGYLVSASGEWCIPGSTYINVVAVNDVVKNTAIPFAENIKHAGDFSIRISKRLSMLLRTWILQRVTSNGSFRLKQRSKKLPMHLLR